MSQVNLSQLKSSWFESGLTWVNSNFDSNFWLEYSSSHKNSDSTWLESEWVDLSPFATIGYSWLKSTWVKSTWVESTRVNSSQVNLSQLESSWLELSFIWVNLNFDLNFWLEYFLSHKNFDLTWLKPEWVDSSPFAMHML